MTIAERTKATEAVRERVMVKSKVPENVKVTETEKLSDIVDQFSSVPDGICARKSPYALHPVSQKFPRRCL